MTPDVTIAIPTHNGLSLLKQSVPTHLQTQYPKENLHFTIVDNASSDGTDRWLATKHPKINHLLLDRNTGFAMACNRGARTAESPYVAFLNNDLKVDPGWLTPLVHAMEEDPQRIAVGSKVLSWDGTRIDFAGGDLNFEARAFQRDFQLLHKPDQYEAENSIFLNGGAMLVRRKEFLDIGGFDEDFFAYYEDVDFGWRAWVLGYTLRWIPESVVYHHHGATSARLSRGQKRFLLERNALLSMFKNYDDENLGRTLSAALLLAGIRTLSGSDIQRNRFRLAPPSLPQGSINLEPEAAAHLAAITDAVSLLPRMQSKRELIQGKRRRTDSEVLSQFGKPDEPIHPGRDYARIQQNLLRGFGPARAVPQNENHVLLISPDILPLAGLPTTGAGLRVWGLGQGLRAKGLSVRFSMPKAALRVYPNVPSEIADLAWDEENLASLVQKSGATVVVACGWPLLERLSECPRPIALDFHGPHLLERTIQGHLDIETNMRTKLACIARADFFTCAGDRQLSYFIPWLMMAGVTYRDQMIRQIPVCVSPDLPQRLWRPDHEPVFVYGGVFLPWQDPSLALTVLVEELEKAGKGRLELYGGKHPFIPLDTRRFEALTKKLASSRRVVSHGMVSHEKLLSAYSRAAVAMDVMLRNPERELAFTTRTVEYLSCGLPVLYNDYADLAHLIREYHAGWVLDPEDADAIRAAVRTVLLFPGEIEERSKNAVRLVKEQLAWDRTIEPLAEFCRSPFFRSHASSASAASSGAEVAALQRAIYDKDVAIRNLEAMLARKDLPARIRYYSGRLAFHFQRRGLSGVASSVSQKVGATFGGKTPR